jgi:hypothetical protein
MSARPTSAGPSPLVAQLHPRMLLDQAFRVDRALTLASLAMGLLLFAALIGLVVDARVITGAPAWLKPAKFAISFALYCLTLVWLLHFVQGRRWIVRIAATVTAIVAVVEVAVIALQAARGTTSHFNQATELDGLLFSIMGASIVVLWLMGVVVAALLLFQRLPNAAFAWSLRLGLAVTLFAMAIGFLMVVPTPQQQAALDAGQPAPIVGAHSVDVPDGGPGLPVVGWSTEGGDLRAPHFVGLHALQVLPLLGWIVTRKGHRLGIGHQTALVFVAGAAHLGLVLLLTWQALRGQPVLRPDLATLAALLALIVLTGLASVSILLHGSRGPRVAAPAG